MLIRIVPVGNPPHQVLRSVREELISILNSKCRLLVNLTVPKEALNHWRKQYDAEKIMELLSGTSEVKFIDKNIPTVLITDVDIYYKGLNFVFGLEDPEKSCCIVSITRLRPEFYDRSPDAKLLIDRTIKEVVHEIGHFIGLDHCQNNWCVMSFSPSVNNVDVKKKHFCEECKLKMMTRGITLG